MAIRDRLRGAAEVLLGISAYEAPRQTQELDEKVVAEIREAMGGQIQPLVTTKLRWYLEDLEAAQLSADQGMMRPCAQLCRAMHRDGYLRGLMGSRTSGLIRLPKRFYGDQAAIDLLRARNGTRSVFDEMFPPGELKQLDRDGIELGVGVGEFVPVKGRSYPVFVRLEPQFLQYRWSENRWYFHGLAGAMPITPGDGRWMLHIPGGRLSPWNDGLWPALGQSFINKQHAIMYRGNYGAKLANPARLAYAPAGATEAQRIGFFKRILAWGVNTVLELPPGWEAKLLESNGRGWEVFQRQIDTCNGEYDIAIAGQGQTTSGGTGFANQEIPDRIRKDLIQDDGDALAYTINTQGLPQFLVREFGEEALYKATIIEYDTGSPVDKERETRTLGQAADAISRLTIALAPHGKSPDVPELTTRFGVPTVDGAVEMLTPVAPEDKAADQPPAPATPATTGAPPAKQGRPTDGDDSDDVD